MKIFDVCSYKLQEKSINKLKLFHHIDLPRSVTYQNVYDERFSRCAKTPMLFVANEVSEYKGKDTVVAVFNAITRDHLYSLEIPTLGTVTSIAVSSAGNTSRNSPLEKSPVAGVHPRNYVLYALQANKILMFNAGSGKLIKTLELDGEPLRFSTISCTLFYSVLYCTVLSYMMLDYDSSPFTFQKTKFQVNK